MLELTLTNGTKNILGVWIGESEGKYYCIQIFDEIKNCGVEDILFISMDGVSGLEEDILYGAASLKAAEAEFERFKQAWSQYPGEIDVWISNWSNVEQLFNYDSAVRKVMYTTNAIEAVNSSFRKVNKKGYFPSEDAVMKALYLRITEIYKNGKDVLFQIGQWLEISYLWTTNFKSEY